MIECRRDPGVFIMTGQAGLWKIILGVVGICRGHIVVLVAAIAFPGDSLELIVDMALNASYRAVSAIKGESLTDLKMIELCCFPTHIVMASLACGRESEGGVGRISGGIEILGMTSVTLGRGTPILRYVAFGAVGTGVLSSQGKRAGMLETGYSPTGRHRLMALPAITRKARLRMVGIGGRLEIGSMANLAFLRYPREFVRLLANVTGATIGDGMNPHQRKATRRVQLEIITAILPVLRCVAILTSGPQLPAMNIDVAVCAGCSYI